jgi:hypothetical protein
MRRLLAAAFLIINAWMVYNASNLFAKQKPNAQNPQNSDILAQQQNPVPLEDDSITTSWRDFIIELLNPSVSDQGKAQVPKVVQPSIPLIHACPVAGPLIVHLAQWVENDGGSYCLRQSRWYVYRVSAPKGKAQGSLTQIISKSSGQPMLYGSKSAWFLGIDSFDKSVSPYIVATYKVSAAPAKAQNVEALGALATALLGATSGTALTAKAALKRFVATSQTFIASRQIDGLAQLPFDFSFAVSVNGLREPEKSTKGDPTPAIPLPKATVGTYYSQRLFTQGGVVDKDGHAAFAIKRGGGSLPEGLDIRKDTGIIYGVPSGKPASSKFTVEVMPDQGTNPIDQDFSITVESGTGGAGKGQADSKGSGDPSKGNSNTPADASQSTSAPNGAVDCNAVSTVGPACTFSHTVPSLDREWWDFSLAVPIPGVREPKYSTSNPAAPPSSTRHTDLYAMLDLYPASSRATKDSAVPHVVVGLPVTGQTFYRPFFGLGENFTGWTGLQRRNFPLGMSVFFGLVDMRQNYVTKNPNSAAGQLALVLKPERVWKAMFGLELPVSSLVSKIGGQSKAGAK